MQWDDAIDLLAGKQSAPKLGRRSSKTTSEGYEDISENAEDTNEPLKTRKTSVWTEDAPKSSRNKTGSNLIEIERFQSDKMNELEDDDIPVIPDIDDIQDDPLNLPDVKPMISVDKSTYKELDNQFNHFQSGELNVGNLGDIDLSFLTNKLYPEKDVQPCLEIWTLDSLFNDLTRSSV